MLKADYYNKTREKISKNIFLNLLKKAEKELLCEVKIKPNKNYLCELTIVGDKAITALNKYYRNKNESTDVISLSYFDVKSPDLFAGEIFICLPFAKRQADKAGRALTDELKSLFIHGLLHIFGYDHQKPIEQAHMIALEQRIICTEA